MRQPDLFRTPKKPWNAGRIIGPKAPLKPKHTPSAFREWIQCLQLAHLRLGSASFMCDVSASIEPAWVACR